MWHQCFADRSWAFLCPNGTIFNQAIFTCVWWFDFDCSTAESFYNLNADLYAGPPGAGASGAETDSGSKAGSNDIDLRRANPAPAAPKVPAAPKAPAAPAAPKAPSAPPAPEPDQYESDYVDDQYESGSDQFDAPAPAVPNAPQRQPEAPVLVPAPANIPSPAPPAFNNFAPTVAPAPDSAPDTYEGDEGAEDEGEGYNYPVPENPLVLPERPQSASGSSPDSSSVEAPLALYGAPAQPFELPPDALPTQASANAAAEAAEEPGLAQYLPPATGSRAGRQGRKLGRRGKRRGQRRKRLSTRVEGAQWRG